MTKRLLLVVGALLAVLLGGVAGAGPAVAHAALIRTDPKEESVAATAPGRVRLWFSEGVLLSADSVKVLAPDGGRADSGGARHIGSDSAAAWVPLRAGLADGTYVVAWKAVSADSHPVAGAFTFSIGAPSKTSVDIAQEQRSAGGGAVGVLYGIGRYLSYSGYALLVGGCAFIAGCWPRGARLRAMRRLTAAGWTTLVGGTIALLLLRAPYANGGGLGNALDLGLVRSELATRPGAALMSRLLLLAAAAVVISVLFGSYARESPGERRDPAWGLGIGGGLVATGLAATWALSEHASVGVQAGAAMPVDIVHLLAMAVWLGGQAALLTALRTAAPAVEREAVLRFSRIAFAAVCLLAATGVYQSWRQVGSWKALFGTDYGRLLTVKVSLVAVMLVLARFSRRWTYRLADAPPAPARGPVEPEPPGAGRTAVGAPAARLTESGAEATADAGTATGGKTGTCEETGTEGGAERAAAGTGAEAATTHGATHSMAVRAGADPVLSQAQNAAEPVTPKTEAGVAATSAEAVGEGADAPGPRPGGEAAPSVSPERAVQLARQAASAAKARARREREADVERGRLRRSVLAEVAVAVAVLAVTTVLTGTQPGRAEEEQAAAAGAAAPSVSSTAPSGRQVDVTVPFDTGGRHGAGKVELTLAAAPGRGVSVLHLLVTGPSGRPLDVPEVDVAFTLRARKIGPIPVTLSKVDIGHWSSDAVSLPIPGRWTASVTVRTSDIDEVTETTSVEIRP